MTRPKHRTQPGATYFVTTNTWQRRGLFRNAALASILEEAIFHYRDRGDYALHRYVIMPDHIHLVLTPGDSTTLEKTVQLIKGGSSREIGKRPGMRFPVWHVGFTEHQIRDQRDFDLHAQYMDDNPVKAHLAALPNEYPYGSAAGKFVLDAWTMVSGAKAHALTPTLRRDWKSRPSNSPSDVG